MSHSDGQDHPLLLGVAGGTGSGKTTVARRVLEALGEERIVLLEMDSYYRDIDWERPEDLLHHNFDHPSALDIELLVEHLTALSRGEAVDVPVYDFVRHRRTDEVRPIESQPVVMLEGILVLALPEIRHLLDFKIYVDTDADIRFIRRLSRDMEERGRSADDVMRQYLGSVRPMHLEFVEPSKRWADVIIPEGGENTVALDMVVARLEKVVKAGD